jgi:hypothetical protein
MQQFVEIALLEQAAGLAGDPSARSRRTVSTPDPVSANSVNTPRTRPASASLTTSLRSRAS